MSGILTIAFGMAFYLKIHTIYYLIFVQVSKQKKNVQTFLFYIDLPSNRAQPKNYMLYR